MIKLWFVKGFRVLLEAHADIQVIGEAENGTQAIQQVEALQPDIVLLDVRMPEMDGVAAVQQFVNSLMM
jgi:YesN/AraC family two-component response regulator